MLTKDVAQHSPIVTSLSDIRPISHLRGPTSDGIAVSGEGGSITDVFLFIISEGVFGILQ